eukprot:4192439-Amphidinium_carterae.1
MDFLRTGMNGRVSVGERPLPRARLWMQPWIWKPVPWVFVRQHVGKFCAAELDALLPYMAGIDFTDALFNLHLKALVKLRIYVDLGRRQDF